MDYDVFKELRVSEDDLHLSTKTQFCVNLVNNINGDFFENNKLQELLNQNPSTKFKNNQNLGILPESLFPNDRKNLDLKNRLRYVLFPEEFENNLLGDPLIGITKKNPNSKKKENKYRGSSNIKLTNSSEDNASDSSTNYINLDEKYVFNLRKNINKENDSKLPLIINNKKNLLNKNINIAKSNFDNSQSKNYNAYSISNSNNKSIRNIFNTDTKRNKQGKNKRISFDEYQNFNSLTEQSNNDNRPLNKNKIIMEENILSENNDQNNYKKKILKAILSPNKNKIIQNNKGNPALNVPFNSQISPYLNRKSNIIQGNSNKFQTPKLDYDALPIGNLNNNYNNYAFTEQNNRNFLPKLINNNFFDLKPKILFKD